MSVRLSAAEKHALRTALQVAVGVVSVVPAVVAHVPVGAIAVQIVAVAAVVTRYFHVVEPFLPSWLKFDEKAVDADAAAAAKATVDVATPAK